MDNDAPLEPAAKIVGLLGGQERVAEIANVHRSRVSRWMTSRDKGGTGGVIPHWHHEALIRHAQANGIRLKPADFAVRIEQ